MILQVYTPEKKIFEGTVQKATMPGHNGSFQVLQNHAHLLSLLSAGNIVYNDEKGVEEKFYLPEGGCVEVSQNTIKVLAW